MGSGGTISTGHLAHGGNAILICGVRLFHRMPVWEVPVLCCTKVGVCRVSVAHLLQVARPLAEQFANSMSSFRCFPVRPRTPLGAPHEVWDFQAPKVEPYGLIGMRRTQPCVSARCALQATWDICMWPPKPIIGADCGANPLQAAHPTDILFHTATKGSTWLHFRPWLK